MLNRHDKKNSVLSGMIIEASHGVTISALLTKAISGIADAIVARRERKLCAKQHRQAKREMPNCRPKCSMISVGLAATNWKTAAPAAMIENRPACATTRWSTPDRQRLSTRRAKSATTVDFHFTAGTERVESMSQ